MGFDQRPSHMIYINPSSKDVFKITLNDLDGVIFDRTQIPDLNEVNLISVSSGIIVDVNDVMVKDPITYLVACYHRAYTFERKQSVNNY